MDPSLAWFAEASSSEACDFIGQGISELRKYLNDEVQKRQRVRQQVEMAVASGRMNAADKTRFDAADTAFEKQNKINEEYDDALIVLALLGSRIVGLGVVNHGEISAANNSVRQAFGGVSGSRYFERFDRLARSVQIGVICGMVFCAECYPMHIWRGFGAAVRSEFDWATFWIGHEPWELLDRSISFLKSNPRSFSLLKKKPEGIERQKPWWRANEKENNEQMWKEGKKERKAMEDAKKDFNKRVEKKGFPQPMDKSVEITKWSIPFATWDSPFVVSNDGHSWTNVLRHQMDPGRLLHAFIVGGHLNLSEGEVMIIPTIPDQSIVRWLEGLNGMTFKLLTVSALDFKKIGLSSSTKKTMKAYSVQELFAVQDPVAVARNNLPSQHLARTPPPSSAHVPQDSQQIPQVPTMPMPMPTPTPTQTPATPTHSPTASHQMPRSNSVGSPSSDIPPPLYSAAQTQQQQTPHQHEEQHEEEEQQQQGYAQYPIPSTAENPNFESTTSNNDNMYTTPSATILDPVSEAGATTTHQQTYQSQPFSSQQQQQQEPAGIPQMTNLHISAPSDGVVNNIVSTDPKRTSIISHTTSVRRRPAPELPAMPAFLN